MADIIITVVSGETTELGLSIPGVQGPIGGDTMPSGGSAGNILVKQSATNYDAAWTSEASGLTLNAATLSGTVTNAGTITGGIVDGATITAPTITDATISSGTADGTALSNAVIDNCTIDNSVIEDTVLSSITLSGTVTNNATVTSGTYSSSIVLSPTISGTISAGSGLIVGEASDVLGFYGASATVQPSGIVIPSGGATVDEVNAAVSGVIVALQTLGLLA